MRRLTQPLRLVLCAAGFVVAMGYGLWAMGDGIPQTQPADAQLPDAQLAGALAYVNDAGARRAALERSVAVASTPYAELRLEHFGSSWAELPVWAPRVRPIQPSGEQVESGVEGTTLPTPTDDASLAEWVDAGRLAFESFPIQIDPTLRRLRDDGAAQRYSMPLTSDGAMAGAVEVELPSGEWRAALTCVACHTGQNRDGAWTAGLTNHSLRFAELLGAPIWPPGVMDVTGDGIENPVQPSDLRALAFQERMHHTGNLANGRIERMVRIETLVIQRLGYAMRPDRRTVAAIALYLESLAETVPAPSGAGVGYDLFVEHCAQCHGNVGMGGPTVPLSLVGTDPVATVDTTRATGGYRAPSLRGVADRGRLLHDASVAGLPELMGLAPSHHEGHRFGWTLSETERAAIVAWLVN